MGEVRCWGRISWRRGERAWAIEVELQVRGGLGLRIGEPECVGKFRVDWSKSRCLSLTRGGEFSSPRELRKASS
eukprot:1391910-Amorphochlora_amoeboformis.AAC.1